MAEACVKILSSEREYSSLIELFDSGEFRSGDTIILLSDITIGEQTVFTKKCTLDLNGHFIFVPIISAMLIKDGVSVTFDNGSIQTLSDKPLEDVIIVQGRKTTLILGGKLEIATTGNALHVRKRGSVIVNGASIKAIGAQPTVIVDDSDSTLEINSGIVASYERSAIVVELGGSAIINDGDIYTESNGLIPETTYPAILVDGNDSRCTVNSGLIHSEQTRAITGQAGASIVMNGGTICSKNEYFPAIELKNNNTSWEMIGGWIYSTQCSAIVATDTEAGSVQTIHVTGGKVGSEDGKPVVAIGGHGDHGILFESGVKVKGELPLDCVVPGYVVSDQKDEEGYSTIILKTWTQEPGLAAWDDKFRNPNIQVIPPDIPPVFPDADKDPDVVQNPFDGDPSLDPEGTGQNPFVAEQIATETVIQDPHLEDFMNPLEDIDVEPLPEVPNDVLYTSTETAEVPIDEIHQVYPMPEPPVPPIPPAPPVPPTPPTPVIFNSSVNIRNTISIYKTPSRKFNICEWKGALRIFDGGYFSPAGEEFAMVKFRVPGSGVTATGYVPVQDISHP